MPDCPSDDYRFLNRKIVSERAGNVWANRSATPSTGRVTGAILRG
jgi:hypothetical protein